MFFFDSKKKDKKNFDREFNAALGATMNEVYSNAAAEFFKIIPELNKISSSKINPLYADANLNQQAGLSAESMHVARTNANNILHHKTIRIQRTDNLGFTNDPLADYCIVDSKGKPIKTPSGGFLGATQSKFLKDPSKYKKLLTDKWYYKYKKANIDIPKDHYPNVMSDLSKEKVNLKKALASQKGNSDAIKERLNRINDLEKRIGPSSLTKSEALDARKYPTIAAFKEAGCVALNSGLQAAGTAAAVGGVVSGVQNLNRLAKGEISFDDAVASIARDSAKSAGNAFVTQASATMLGGAMKASQSSMLKNLAKDGGPTAIVLAGQMLANNVVDLVKGKLSPTDFVEKTSADSMTLGASLYGSNIGAAIETGICPGLGTVVGGFIGGMVCSAAMQAAIGPLKKASMDAKLAEQHRDQVKKVVQEFIKQERLYRETTLKYLNQCLKTNEREVSTQLYTVIDNVVAGKDISRNLEKISEALHLNVNFFSKEDVKGMIVNGETIQI